MREKRIIFPDEETKEIFNALACLAAVMEVYVLPKAQLQSQIWTDVERANAALEKFKKTHEGEKGNE